MKCLWCPVDRGPCVSESGPDLCGAAQSSDPVVTRHIRARSAVPAAKVDTAPTAAEVMRLSRAVRACAHFEARHDLGCGCNFCRLGKGRSGVVGWHDCIVCQANGGP